MRTTASPTEDHDHLVAGESRAEAERALIAGLLMGHPEAFTAAAAIVEPSDLVSPRHRRLWARLAARHAAGLPVPPIDENDSLLARLGAYPDFTGRYGALERARRVKVHSLHRQLGAAADELARNPADTTIVDRLEAIRAELGEWEAFRTEIDDARNAAARQADDECIAWHRDHGHQLEAAKARYATMTRTELLAAIPTLEQDGAR